MSAFPARREDFRRGRLPFQQVGLVPAAPGPRVVGATRHPDLISKVFHADALKCRDCGGPLQVIAYITDQLAINKILDHLGLSPPEEARPPPEVRYVPIGDEGRELPGMVAE